MRNEGALGPRLYLPNESDATVRISEPGSSAVFTSRCATRQLRQCEQPPALPCRSNVQTATAGSELSSSDIPAQQRPKETFESIVQIMENEGIGLGGEKKTIHCEKSIKFNY